MTFVDASPDVEVRGLAKLRPYDNFFLGDDPNRWRSRVPTFDSVLYEGLYPGVDVELHRRQGRIEYDFILAPGVDPSVVRVGSTRPRASPRRRSSARRTSAARRTTTSRTS